MNMFPSVQIATRRNHSELFAYTRNGGAGAGLVERIHGGKNTYESAYGDASDASEAAGAPSCSASSYSLQKSEASDSHPLLERERRKKTVLYSMHVCENK